MKTTIEKLEFPKSVKERITRSVSSKITIAFVAGKNIRLNNTNIGLNEPHKVIFSNDTSSLVIIFYENCSDYYLYDLSTAISLNRIIELVNGMK